MGFREFLKNKKQSDTAQMTEYTVSQDTALTLSKALTTLTPGDRLEIKFGSETIIIKVLKVKIRKTS